MDSKIVELARDPYSVVLADRVVPLVVDPPTGDIFLGSPVLHASKGLAFSLVPGPTGQMLRLQYSTITIDIGCTDGVADPASWVEAVNAFLATKRDTPLPNGQPMLQTPAGSPVH